jgi:hypothetical protein
MDGDLFRTPLCSDVLRLDQQRPPAVATQADQILGDQRNCTPRALLPGCVGRRVDDDLTDDSPTSVMRVATRDQKPRQCVGHALGFGLRPVSVEVPQRGTHVSAVVYRPRQLPGGLRSLSFRVDPFTVAARKSFGGACEAKT